MTIQGPGICARNKQLCTSQSRGVKLKQRSCKHYRTLSVRVFLFFGRKFDNNWIDVLYSVFVNPEPDYYESIYATCRQTIIIQQMQNGKTWLTRNHWFLIGIDKSIGWRWWRRIHTGDQLLLAKRLSVNCFANCTTTTTSTTLIFNKFSFALSLNVFIAVSHKVSSVAITIRLFSLSPLQVIPHVPFIWNEKKTHIILCRKFNWQNIF